MNAVPTVRPRPLTLKARTAADLMTRQVVSVPADAPLAEAVATLTTRGFSGAPVVNEAGRAVGVVSLSDIVVREHAGGGRVPAAPLVRDVMTPAVCGVRPDTPADRVIEEMVLLHVHRLFVTDRDGVLVGVIATTDVLRHLIA